MELAVLLIELVLGTLFQNLDNNNSNNGLWAGSTRLWLGAVDKDLRIQ